LVDTILAAIVPPCQMGCPDGYGERDGGCHRTQEPHPDARRRVTRRKPFWRHDRQAL